MTLRDVMDLEGKDVHLVPVIDRVRTLRELRARLATAKVRWPSGRTSGSVAEGIAREPSIPIAVKNRISHFPGGTKAEKTNHLELLISISDSSRTFSKLLGDRLPTAVSTGEAPSLADVRTIAEMHQVIDLAESRSLAITSIIFARERYSLPVSNEMVECMLRLGPNVAEDIIITATDLVEHLDWPRVRHLVLLVTRQAGPSTNVRSFVFFLKECIRNNLTEKALDLFLETGLAERWAPLHEVLRAVADGSRAWLDGLAPEMRVAAAGLYDQLCAPDAPLAHEGAVMGNTAPHPPAHESPGPRTTSPSKPRTRKPAPKPRAAKRIPS